jgi:uncharacterized protein YcfJ
MGENSMKKIALGVLGAIGLAGIVPIAAAQAYGDVARVISATPLYERISAPRRECRTEQVTAYEQRRSIEPAPLPEPAREPGIGVGTVLGAIVGGVIGHQFGNSSGGRDHGTAAGAVIGGLVGNSIEREAQAADYQRASRDVVVERVPVTRDVERCSEVAESREKIVGYDVRYEYNGREFRARLPYDPGTEMPVNVEVRPPAASAPLGQAGPRAPVYRGPY